MYVTWAAGMQGPRNAALRQVMRLVCGPPYKHSFHGKDVWLVLNWVTRAPAIWAPKIAHAYRAFKTTLITLNSLERGESGPMLSLPRPDTVHVRPGTSGAGYRVAPWGCPVED